MRTCCRGSSHTGRNLATLDTGIPEADLAERRHFLDATRCEITAITSAFFNPEARTLRSINKFTAEGDSCQGAIEAGVAELSLPCGCHL